MMEFGGEYINYRFVIIILRLPPPPTETRTPLQVGRYISPPHIWSVCYYAEIILFHNYVYLLWHDGDDATHK